MKSDTRFCQTNEILCPMESSRSTNVSIIMPTGVTVIHTSLQSLFLQHLHKGATMVLSLQPSLPVSLHNDILRHLYRDISTVVSLQSFLLASLRTGLLPLLTSLRSGFLWPSLLTSLRNIFLQHLYRGISIVLSIQTKLVIFLRRLYGCISTVLSIQTKSGTPICKLLLRKSIPISTSISLLHFYKYHGYNVIDRIITYMVYANNISFQCTSIGNKDDEKNSIYIWLIKNTIYNFLNKLRSGFGQEDDFTTKKWTWFDVQICITFLLTRIIS